MCGILVESGWSGTVKDWEVMITTIIIIIINECFNSCTFDKCVARDYRIRDQKYQKKDIINSNN